MKVLLLAGVYLLSSPALADAPLPNPLLSFFPSADARTRERAAHAAHWLETSLALQPHVRAVRAHVELVSPDAAKLDAPFPPPAVRVAIKLDGDGPTDAAILASARAVLPELSASALRIQRFPHVPVPVAPAFAQVGPFKVAPASAPPLRFGLALLLASNALLAFLLLWSRKRQR